MLNLLSRSKHEEFKSNSALQIRDQKERRAENTQKMELAKFASYGYCSCLKPATVHPAAIVHLLFDVMPCLLKFSFLPILSLLIPSDFGFFFVFFPLF